MLEMCSQSLAKKNISYYDYFSDSHVESRNLCKLITSCQTEDKPLILRHFAAPGGIGKNDAMRTIDGFLKYQADKHPRATTYCQLESGDGGHYEWEDLRKQFQLPPNARAYKANLLGVSLMNYQNLYTNIQFPEFLEHMDLLRRGAEMCDDPEKLSQGLKCVPELGFAVISMEGATSLPNEDHWPTFLIVHEGCLTVWMAKTSAQNQEMRLSWVPTDGLLKFQDSFTIDLQRGDILLIPAGTIHAAYSPEKKLMCGGHFVVPENLAETLRASTRHKIFRGSTNDESRRATTSTRIFHQYVGGMALFEYG
jgi:mannose-6-phosphate isomerase-like protein (cupin superfamily)